MKKTVRMLMLALVLLGSVAASVETVKADGGGPGPTCDPASGKCTP